MKLIFVGEREVAKTREWGERGKKKKFFFGCVCFWWIEFLLPLFLGKLELLGGGPSLCVLLRYSIPCWGPSSFIFVLPLPPSVCNFRENEKQFIFLSPTHTKKKTAFNKSIVSSITFSASSSPFFLYFLCVCALFIPLHTHPIPPPIHLLSVIFFGGIMLNFWGPSQASWWSTSLCHGVTATIAPLVGVGKEKRGSLLLFFFKRESVFKWASPPRKHQNIRFTDGNERMETKWENGMYEQAWD